MSQKANFDDVSSARPGDVVPDGNYEAIIIGIEPGQTRGGGDRWEVYSEITAGPEKGKVIRDQWLWYGGGMGRTKACISGCDVVVLKGDADYYLEDFMNRPVILEVRNTTREVGEGEAKKVYKECKPTYSGYHFDDRREYVPMPRRELPLDDSKIPF